jgi:Protein of unknown function (DUF3152)
MMTGDMLALNARPVPVVTATGPAESTPRTSTPTATATPSAGPTTTASPKRKPSTAPQVVVPASGPGTYDAARVAVKPASREGRLIRFDVKVEKNLDIDPDQAARLIAEVLNDNRSWSGSRRWRWELVRGDSDQAEMHAYIVTPGTTDQLCAPLQTQGEVSCQNGNRVVLNAKRWQLGAKSYGSDLVNYRRYLVNHEFGHYIGYGHVDCPGRGKLAPIMLQQTKGLQGCRKNPWVESD